MHAEDIKNILRKIKLGELSVAKAMDFLAHLPYAAIECANLDLHRPLRTGISEVVFGEGKSFEQLEKIVATFDAKKLNVLGTRTCPESGRRLRKIFAKLRYDGASGTFMLVHRPPAAMNAKVAVCCAGTADIKVAEEAARTLEFFGVEAKKYYDIGVAGLHRLISKMSELKEADVLVVVAGMEGALPSVVGGMFPQPIIAVPTSVGYGVNFGGIAPLMAMLCGCAEGVTVVNIDNGFGAACAALRIANRLGKS